MSIKLPTIDCNGSLDMLELVLHQVENLVALTEPEKHLGNLHEFLREISIRLRGSRKDYIQKSGMGAISSKLIVYDNLALA